MKMMPPGRDDLMDGRNNNYMIAMPGHPEQQQTSHLGQNGQPHTTLSKAELRKVILLLLLLC